MDLNTLIHNALPLHTRFKWNPIQINSKCREGPSARWGHSMTLTNGHLYIFGGYAGNSNTHLNFKLQDAQYMNDLWIFDIKESVWTRGNPNGETPEKRSNHSAVYDKVKERYNQISRCSYCIRIVVFGGGSSAKKRFNDTYAYYPKTNHFEQITTV